MSTGNVGIAIFNTHGEAENAVKELQKSGFDMKKLSIVGKDYHTEEHVVAYYNTGDRMKYWGKLGAFWGGLWGILFGAAVFWIPGIGPLVVAGPLVSAIVGGLEGVRWQLEDYLPLAPVFTALAFRRTALSSMNPPSSPTSFCWWFMARGMSWPRPRIF